jgi:UDP-glucuronate 4-epimerase
MKILVTGAAGFIGSHVVAELIRRGHEVWGIDAFRPTYSRERKEQFVALAQGVGPWAFEERTVGSLTTTDLAGVDAVLHLAGQADVRESWETFDTHIRDNVSETNHLGRIAGFAHVPRIVYASTSSVYGESTAYPVRESLLPAPLSPYGVTKLAGEHSLAAHATAAGYSVVSLRLFTVFGPGQRDGMAIARLVSAALTGDPFTMIGNGEQQRDLVYVADVARAFADSIDANVDPGLTCLNIGMGSSISLRELIGMVQDVTGSHVSVNEVATQSGEPQRTEAAVEEARRWLGWSVRTALRDGIAQQLAFERDPSLAHWSAGLYDV